MRLRVGHYSRNAQKGENHVKERVGHKRVLLNALQTEVEEILGRFNLLGHDLQAMRLGRVLMRVRVEQNLDVVRRRAFLRDQAVLVSIYACAYI